MWRENPTWGQRIIAAELAKLGYQISPRTVAKYRPSDGEQTYLEPRGRLLKWRMMVSSIDESPIPEARVDDLDLGNETDAATWDARMDAMAERRIRQARARLEQMGVIDRDGHLVSRELPPDMLPSSLTSVETG